MTPIYIPPQPVPIIRQRIRNQADIQDQIRAYNEQQQELFNANQVRFNENNINRTKVLFEQPSYVTATEPDSPTMSTVSSLTDPTNMAFELPQQVPSVQAQTSVGSSDFQITSSLESYFEAPEEEPSLESSGFEITQPKKLDKKISLGEKQEETRDPKVLAQHKDVIDQFRANSSALRGGMPFFETLSLRKYANELTEEKRPVKPRKRKVIVEEFSPEEQPEVLAEELQPVKPRKRKVNIEKFSPEEQPEVLAEELQPVKPTRKNMKELKAELKAIPGIPKTVVAMINRSNREQLDSIAKNFNVDIMRS